MREVYADYESTGRIEIETDGQIIEVGHDIDDGRCITFTHENRREFVDKVRAVSSVESFTRKTPDSRRHSFVLWRSSMGTYTFYDEDGILLKIHDHEAGALYRASSLSVEYRTKQYDFERYADKFVESLVAPKRWDIEKESTKNSGYVKYTVTDDTCVWVDLDFVETVKESEYASWNGGMVENGDETPTASYRFHVNGKQLAKDDSE